MKRSDTLMQHSISSSTFNNASKSSCNTIQGHYHGKFEIAYFADMNILRWSMTVGCLMAIDSPATHYADGILLKRPIIGCGLLLGPEGNTLVISDLHMPYEHKAAFKFLWAVAKKYKVKLVLSVGDLIDHHTGSYHETEPDAFSPEEEFKRAKRKLHELQHMFPKMVITNGNHDEIPKRKMRSVGLPMEMVADYNRLYDLKDSWLWVKKYEFNCEGAKPVLVPMHLKKGNRWNERVI